MKADKDWQEWVNDSIERAAQRAVALYDEVNERRFGQVIEAIESMRNQVAKIPKMEADIADLKTDMKAVKAAVKATNDDLRNLGLAW